ncbi:MAG: sugar phosphate isomerase/epimerase family protein, partial [Chloroflexota bacterium]
SLSYKDEFAAHTLDLEGFIERAYALRLDGIDIHTRAFASKDPAYLRQIRMLAQRRGLALSYIGISNNFGKPAGELPGQVQMVKDWVDVAAYMGIPLVRIFAAWIPPGEDTESVWARMMPCMQEVAAYGQQKGVVIGLHNHNHGCITATSQEVLRILREVDNPYFSHILDTGQYIGSPGSSGSNGVEDPTKDFYGSIAATAPYAVHVRAKIYRIQTGEEAWLNYPRILGILRQVNYNGWMSIVYEGQAVEPEATAVPKAVSYLRGLLDSLDM